MRLGAILPPSDGANSSHIIESAVAIEQAGFDSVWCPQAIGRGFMMPDPFIALSAVAAVTDTVELGTAVLQLSLYNPTDIALKALSLQLLSNGRFVMGVGAGSTKNDFDVHNLDYKSRFRTFNDTLIKLRETLKDGSAGEGNLSPWKPVVGGPPIYFGTWGKNVERAATEFDGWMASGMHRTQDECIDALNRYRDAGGTRAIVTTILVNPNEDSSALQDKLLGFAEAGFDDAVVMLMPGGFSLPEIRALVPRG